MPMIPIHVAEIKKLIVKDQMSGDENLNDDHLLNVLNSNSCGKNPTFFKAFGHNEVFGLKNAIPDGGTVVEIVEKVPVECDNWTANDDVQFRQDGVLYVHLPDGHPVITGSISNERFTSPVPLPGPSNTTIAVPEVTEADGPNPSPAPVVESPKVPDVEPVRKTMNTRNKNSDNKISYAEIDEDDTTSKKHRHNLRPQKPNRHVHALKQQAKRRQKNKNVAAGVPLPQRTMSRRSTVTSNGEIEIAFKPTSEELDRNPQTMKELLTSIPGFNLRKLQLKGQNKKFTNAQMIQQTKEGSINLDTPDSILTKVNLRTLLNKATFSRLPPMYQFKLMQLLPQVDLLFDDNKGLRLNSSAFNNEFFAKACHEWRERLYKGDFTPEALQKNRSDLEKDKQRLDPWKLKNYEPLWGMKRSYDASTNVVTIIPADTKPLEGARTRRSAPVDRETEHETGKRKSERRKVNIEKVEQEVTSIVIQEAPAIFEESVIEVSPAEVVCESSTPEVTVEPVVADNITEEDNTSESPNEALSKSPRVTISHLSEEIHDIYEPANKKRKTEDLSEPSLPEPSIIKSFNDPILELDSKYDLSPEETCPENFMESMDEGNENENVVQSEEVKEEDDFKPDISDTQKEVEETTEIEKVSTEPKLENPICDDELTADVKKEDEEEDEPEDKIVDTRTDPESPELPSETEAVISKEEVEDEKEQEMMSEDSQPAPTLSSEEPVSSVDSNVLSVEMPPPTLSPNYGSPNREDISEEEPMETVDDVEDEEKSEEQVNETTATTMEVCPTTVLSCANSDLSQDFQREIDLDDPQGRSEVCSVSSLRTIQLPTVPLSLHDTKLFTSSLKSPVSSQSASPEVLEALEVAESVKTISPQKETAVS